MVVRSDNELMVNQIHGKYGVYARRVIPLHREAVRLLRELEGRGNMVEVVWIPREENAEADRLSHEAYERYCEEHPSVRQRYSDFFATEKQKAFLKRLGMECGEWISKREASRLIDMRLKERGRWGGRMEETVYQVEGKKVKVVERGDVLKVFTPYNADFVKEIKKIPTRRWNGEAWEVNKAYKEEVLELVKRFFPVEEETWHYLFVLSGEKEEYVPAIDGVSVVRFGRDWAEAKSRLPSVEVYWSRLESGGSRKYPYWSGVVVLGYHGRENPRVSGGKWKELYRGKGPIPAELVRKAIAEQQEMKVEGG